jgi:hypothetical protein
MPAGFADLRAADRRLGLGRRDSYSVGELVAAGALLTVPTLGRRLRKKLRAWRTHHDPGGPPSVGHGLLRVKSAARRCRNVSVEAGDGHFSKPVPQTAAAKMSFAEAEPAENRSTIAMPWARVPDLWRSHSKLAMQAPSASRMRAYCRLGDYCHALGLST